MFFAVHRVSVMTIEQYELPLSEVSKSDTDSPPLRHLREEQGVREQEIVDQAFAILSKRHRRGEILTSPQSTEEFLRLKLSAEPNEVFGCIFLDNRHGVLAVEDLFFGTIDGASVHPRVIVQKALLHNAAATLAYHNHPSGIPEPSQADLRITKRIKD
jgi:DNA repair protein RadC